MKTVQPWIDKPFQLISWEAMLRFSAQHHVKLGSILKDLESTLVNISNPQTELASRKVFKEVGEFLEVELRLISCEFSAEAAKRFASDVSSLSKEGIQIRSKELQSCIYDEMASHLFLWVPSDQAKFFNQTEKTFGEDVARNFPSVLSEIREAGNCYATGCSTACVFHLMRVMESGVRAVYLSLSLAFDPRASWEMILQNWGKDEIKANPTANAILMANLTFYQNSRSTVSSVKDSWRNPTMHFDRSYNESEALEIMTAVRGFMKCIAAELDQIGGAAFKTPPCPPDYSGGNL
jgi:hypothetical protein